MRIESIEIEAFGKLEGISLDLDEGINLIEGKNESGKSTILAFLRFVFYGFPRRNAADGGDEREKRLTWREKRAAGSVTLKDARGGRYRVTRSAYLRGSGTRAALTEELFVSDLTTGDAVDIGDTSAGEYFFSLPAELYDSSLCLSQSDAARVSSPGVHEAVGNMLFSGDSTLCAEEAEKTLQNARRELQHTKGRGGRLAALEDEDAALAAALGKASEDAERLSSLRAENQLIKSEIARRRAQSEMVAAGLERIEAMRALERFGELSTLAAEEARTRAALEQEQARLAAIPSRNEISRAALALRDAEIARETVERIAPEIEELRRVTHDEKLLRDAELIQKRGGAQEILQKTEESTRRARRFFLLSLGFLLAAAICGGLILPLQTLIVPLGAGAGALFASAAVFAVLALRCRRFVREIVKTLSLRGSAMLRTYLQQCEREDAAYQAYRERLAAGESALTAAATKEKASLAALRATGALPEGASELPTLREASEMLTELNKRQNAAAEAKNAAQIAYERAHSACSVLRAQVGGTDEETLRRRIAALPDTGESAESLRAKQEYLNAELAALEEKRAAGERAEAALSATVRDPLLLRAERERVGGELATLRRRLDAVNMALEALGEASEELRRGITPRLREDASRIFAELTEGKYASLSVSNDFSLSIEVGGAWRPISHFSAGCRDAAYLSLRLALLATLSDEKLPLFFDEAFSRLDDERAAALLGVLARYAAAGGQAILFTCHTREAVMLDGMATYRRFAL